VDVKKPALGKGLDAILGARTQRAPVGIERDDNEAEGARHSSGLQLVEIEKVFAGRGQPRRNFREEGLEELAASIRAKGILQPLVVTKTAAGYELIAGERRLRAAARAGLEKVPVIVKAEIEPAELVELALIENVQREDLTAMELARGYQRLIDQYHYTQEQLATRIGKSRVTIANTLRLLGLPDPVRDALEQALITEGHARALLALPTAAAQISACRTIVQRGLSVRETEELVRGDNGRAGRGKGAVGQNGRAPSAELKAIADRLTRTLGTRVTVRGSGERGRIQIEFYSRGEFEGLLDRIARA
jgi:ParB family transcriptional regulator, chromosome partitioning protein